MMPDQSILEVDSIVNKAGTGAPDFPNGQTVSAGAEATPSITPTSDPNTGVYFPAADTVGISINGSEAMRIDSSGNLLVGTTDASPNGIPANAAIVSLNDDVRFAAAFGALNSTSDKGAIVFHNPNGLVGSINTNGFSTGYNTSSDYRLKTDVQTMTGATERLKALNPVNFAWKADGSRVDGFIAHETQEVVPEAVTGTKDAVDAEGNPEYQGIDQSKLVPLLTAALQEAVSKIEFLEQRIAALETAAA